MFKKSYFIYTTMILVSIVLGACSAAPGSEGKTNLPTQAMTDVASIVNDANRATQIAGTQTPIVAGGSSSPQANTAKTPGALGSGSGNQGSSTGNSTPAAGQGSTVRTPAATNNAAAVPKTPEATPGIMNAALDWGAPWMKYVSGIPEDFYTISVDGLVNLIESGTVPFLLDVRDTEEVSQYGYIKGAVNIPYQEVFKNLDKLPATDEQIVVYSGVGHRGTIIMSALRLLGYTNVVVLDGGMSTWLTAGQPAELGTPPVPTSGTAPEIDTTKISDLEKFIATGTYGVDATELNSWLADPAKPIIIDVREKNEALASGVIKDSLQIPFGSLLENLNQLPADMKSPIVIVDSTGHRGTIAMMAMRMLGYSNVRSLFGGYQAWVDAGLPTVK